MRLNEPQPAASASNALPADVKAALAEAVQRLGTQVDVAKALGITSPVVSTLLKDKYQGDVKRMEELIRGTFMQETVMCPVMGELGRHSCLQYQARPLVHTNPQRARLHAACKTCPNNKGGKS